MHAASSTVQVTTSTSAARQRLSLAAGRRSGLRRKAVRPRHVGIGRQSRGLGERGTASAFLGFESKSMISRQVSSLGAFFAADGGPACGVSRVVTEIAYEPLSIDDSVLLRDLFCAALIVRKSTCSMRTAASKWPEARRVPVLTSNSSLFCGLVETFLGSAGL
jgi:hypothetical protein